VTPEQARVLLTARQTPEQRASTYTTAYWPRSAADAAGDFYTKFLPALRTLGAPDAVRLVFGFDG